jgi:hypothetical protein
MFRSHIVLNIISFKYLKFEFQSYKNTVALVKYMSIHFKINKWNIII